MGRLLTSLIVSALVLIKSGLVFNMALNESASPLMMLLFEDFDLEFVNSETVQFFSGVDEEYFNCSMTIFSARSTVWPP